MRPSGKEPTATVITAHPPSPAKFLAGSRALVPGLGLAVAIAVAATVIGRFVPLVGGPVTGIVIGVGLAVLLKPGDRLRPGITTASKFVLQLSVVVLGSQLSLAQIARVGLESLPVMLGTLVVCLIAAYLLGRWLDGNLRRLRHCRGDAGDRRRQC